ncbi:UDP-glucose dehydrogenase family protein [Candidatus Pantoea carbekii]|uniref:UDP-glucose 6-dehydrogenase n=1 Tax=Candidatus Pantoea carbekii TaxID=1235990 RepID=U3U8B1_9GAMM|nr:UDP-glucose/GDP-mannose dehydrogenase family protein [Candidatus Pantoea carbekii]AKC32058.1 UDP-glucose 6-dehydrogenase Udg [Candidatus Pantoea carbekii]BAO00584.1 Udg protein [Candidatus Pantoea carbekii]
MKLTVFGIGYVGLVHAAILAEVGHHVLCIDIDEKKIKNLNAGIIPIFEPGLKPLVLSNYQAGRLKFTTNAHQGVEHSIINFITVGTPTHQNGYADLSHVTSVANTIAKYMNTYKVIIDKSTVPIGTSNAISKIIKRVLKKRNLNTSFDIVSNPEFLQQGGAINDCMHPERIVIGIDNDNDKLIDLLCQLYEPINKNHNRIIFMDRKSAELTKYAANCMLATKISFMNEIANLAEYLGADIEKVRQGIGSDSRIGYDFIYPGCGYGGSCFPKDIRELIRTAELMNYTPRLLKAVEDVNNCQKNKLSYIIQHYFGNDLRGKVFAVWGLAFKPNTDDMREAPSRNLMEALWSAGAIIQAFDPQAMDETQRIYGDRSDLKLMDTKEKALEGADGLVICTEWQNFRAPNFNVIKSALKQPVIFDGRNLYDPELIKKYGFIYYAIGRGESIQTVRSNQRNL